MNMEPTNPKANTHSKTNAQTLLDTPVGHSCKAFLRDTLLWDALVNQSLQNLSFVRDFGQKVKVFAYDWCLSQDGPIRGVTVRVSKALSPNWPILEVDGRAEQCSTCHER